MMDDGAWRPVYDERLVVADPLEVEICSPAIMRLIEEVRVEETGVPRSYNRTFNRHNR